MLCLAITIKTINNLQTVILNNKKINDDDDDDNDYGYNGDDDVTSHSKHNYK